MQEENRAGHRGEREKKESVKKETRGVIREERKMAMCKIRFIFMK